MVEGDALDHGAFPQQRQQPHSPRLFLLRDLCAQQTQCRGRVEIAKLGARGGDYRIDVGTIVRRHHRLHRARLGVFDKSLKASGDLVDRQVGRADRSEHRLQRCRVDAVRHRLVPETQLNNVLPNYCPRHDERLVLPAEFGQAEDASQLLAGDKYRRPAGTAARPVAGEIIAGELTPPVGTERSRYDAADVEVAQAEQLIPLVQLRQTDMRVTRSRLEPILHGEGQHHRAARYLRRRQQHEIRRRPVLPVAGIGERPPAPRSRASLPGRVRIFDLDFRLGARSGFSRLGPHMPASRDIAAFDQRTATDKAPRRRDGIYVD